MSLWIIGKNGFIANYFAKTQKAFETLGDVFYTTSNIKEVNNKNVLHLELKNPVIFPYWLIEENDMVFMLAGISSPEKCRIDVDAFDLNTNKTIKFLRRVLDRGARVLFFSTDAVYGNRFGANELSAINPYGWYAKGKADVEGAFYHDPRFKVFRLSYVFAKDDKFTSYLQNCLNTEKIAEVYQEFERSVVYVNDVIDASFRLAKHWNTIDIKIFNLCGPELISRYDMAKAFSKKFENFQYSIKKPPDNFYKDRVEKIHTKSLVLNKLLNRETIPFIDAFDREF